MSQIVSVIIPTHNDAYFLDEAIASVRRACQNAQLEILIINDGSTSSGSLKALSKIESSNHDVRVIHQDGEGLAAARNAGLDAACGDYIQFLDADDLLSAGKIDSQMTVLDSMGAGATVCSFVYANSDISSWWNPVKNMFPTDFTPKAFVREWEVSLSIPIHAALFRAHAIETIRFDVTLAAKEDWIFWTNFAETNPNVVFRPDDPGAVYRQHQKNMTRNHHAMAAAWIAAFRKLEWVWCNFNEAEVLETLQSFWERYGLSGPVALPSRFSSAAVA